MGDVGAAAFRKGKLRGQPVGKVVVIGIQKGDPGPARLGQAAVARP